MLKLFGQQRLDTYNSSSASRRRSRTFVINPLSRYRMFWDLCISLCILYSAIEIPFTTAFLPQPPLLMRVLDILIDSVLLSDVIVCFFTGYVDQDDVITMDHAKVVNHYLRGWFFFDLLSVIPFELAVDRQQQDTTTTTATTAATTATTTGTEQWHQARRATQPESKQITILCPCMARRPRRHQSRHE